MKNAKTTANHRIAYILCITFFCYFSFACSEKRIAPEEEIKQYIENAKLAAENRDHSELADFILETYADQRDMNKKQLIKMLRAYFFSHQNIHLFTDIERIELQSETNAFVTVYVAMAGNVITDVNALSSLRARIYRLELRLIKDEQWFLQQAKWQPASIRDLL